MIGTDFMGHVSVTLSDLPKGRETEQWYKLTARSSKKDVVSGEVLVRILFSVESSMPPSLASATALGGSFGSPSVGGVGGGLAAAAGKRMADMGTSSPTLSSNGSGSSLNSNSMSLGSSSARVIGEEEYSAMDDMRSGEIDLILPAILAHAASLPCLQIGLPAFAKWATTASVAERVAILEQYKGGVFEMLVATANEFKADAVVVFYALLAFSPFLRIAEAKPYFTSTIASLLAGSLQEPPHSLVGEDRTRHCANCVVALANAATMPAAATKGLPTKQSAMRSEMKTKCAEILVSSGALAVAVSLFSSSFSPASLSTSFSSLSSPPLNKLILGLIIKTAHFPPALRIIHDNGFVANASKLLANSEKEDHTSLWLTLDALAQYASEEFMVHGKSATASGSGPTSGTSSLSGSSNVVTSTSIGNNNGITSGGSGNSISINSANAIAGTSPRGTGLILSNVTYAQDVLAVPSLFPSLSHLASIPSVSGANGGLSGASIASGIIYLLKSVSSLINTQNAAKFGVGQDAHFVTLLAYGAAASYTKFIPRNEQKSLVAEYSLLLLEKFGDAEGQQTQQQLTSHFADTLKMVLDFARFPSVVARCKSYIEKIISWGVLSKEQITDIIQKERESHEDLDNSRKVISDLLAQL